MKKQKYTMTFEQLFHRYIEKGIYLARTRNNRLYYLRVLGSPIVVQGKETDLYGCRYTHACEVSDRELLEDVEKMSRRVFEDWQDRFRDNPIMLAYAEKAKELGKHKVS